jgi:hypothetical protein
MHVRRRNQLVRTFHAVLYCIPIALIGWVIWQAEGRRHPMKTGILLAVCAACLAGLHLWLTISVRRVERELDRELREAGVDPDMIPDPPLPVIPRLRLAKDRDQLIAGILFLVLLVFTFVAYYAGWIEKMMGDPPRPY